MTTLRYLADPEAADRDELSARRDERDRQREPWRRRARRVHQRRRGPHLAVRFATDSVPVPCPLCNATCFASGDSHGERIDCVECESALVTRRALGGELSLEALDERAPGGAA